MQKKRKDKYKTSGRNRKQIYTKVYLNPDTSVVILNINKYFKLNTKTFTLDKSYKIQLHSACLTENTLNKIM